MRASLLASLLLLGVLAGCLGGGDDEGEETPPEPPAVAPEWPLLALPHGDDHVHENVSHHQNLSTPNFELLGWDPLYSDYHGLTSGDYACGDVSSEGDRRIGVVHSLGTDVAFVLVDVTDPEAPEKVGEYVLKRAGTRDVAITPKGDFVAIAISTGRNQLLTDDEDPPGAIALRGTPETTTAPAIELGFRDRCGNYRAEEPYEDVPYMSGTMLIDVRDPANPRFADFVPEPSPLGVHSIFATEIDGTKWVLSSTTNLEHQASTFTFFTVEDTVLGPRLQEYGAFSAQYPGVATDVPFLNGHVDGWIAKHPGTGDLLGWLANWDGGLVIVRLAGAGRIEPVGQWTNYAGPEDDPRAELAFSGADGQIHEAYPLPELWGDRHYTFIGQELGGPPPGRPTGQVIMMDTTDPANPTPYARWTLPMMTNWTGSPFLLFSTHYLTVQNGTIFVALYHGGVWAVGTEPVNGTKELPTLGVFLPANATPRPPPANHRLYARWTPFVMEVLRLQQNDLLVYDAMSGAYTIRWHPEVAVPVPAPWTEDSWV